MSLHTYFPVFGQCAADTQQHEAFMVREQSFGDFGRAMYNSGYVDILPGYELLFLLQLMVQFL